jgi:hypothetical protein
MSILIKPGGTITAVYDESIDLAALGTVAIRRASHVEPDFQGHWTADLSPLKGPILGPFHTRSEALDAERGWIETVWLLHNE